MPTTPAAADDEPARRGNRRSRLADDRGSTSVEMVGYTAVMLLALLIGVQAAVWGLAEMACRYSANHALQAARVHGGTAGAGHDDARLVLTEINANLVTDPTIETSRDTTTATVTVKGRALQVVPFLSLPVGATVTAPIEKLSSEVDG